MHLQSGDVVSKYFPATPETTTAIVLLVVLLFYTIVNKVLTHFSAPIRNLRGPKSINWLTGSHARSVWEPDAQDNQLSWIRQYGHVFRYYGWFNVSNILSSCRLQMRPSFLCQMTRVVTTDPQALNYILNAPEFEKPEDGRRLLGDMVGKGWHNFLGVISI